jgi:hypothetical protein
MKSRKINYILGLVCLLFSFLLQGCRRPVVILQFPLKNHASWIYKGVTQYKIIGTAEKTPPMKYVLASHQLSKKTSSPFSLTLSAEGSPLETLQLMKTPKGIINPLTGDLWIPRQIKMGDTWNTHDQGSKISFTLSSMTKITVPAGTFSIYIINFKGPQKYHGSFSLDPSVGIISFNWSARSSSGLSQTRLKLVSYQLH